MRLGLATLMLAVCTLLTFGANTRADEPSPFGLTIGHTKQTEANAQYGLRGGALNHETGARTFSIDPAALKFDGLWGVLLVFDKEQTLVEVDLVFDKSRLDDLRAICDKNYTTVIDGWDFPHGPSMRYQQGHTKVRLRLSDARTAASLRYTDDAYDAAVTAIYRLSNDEKQRRQREESALTGGSNR